WFGLASYGTSGRYNLYANNQTGGRMFNTLYFGNFDLYRHWLPEFPLTGVVHVESAYLQNGDTNNTLELGGDSGMRGFKVNAFTGDKSLLMNLENRFFIPAEILHLIYIGGVTFVDVGQAQPQGQAFRRQDFHADIG